MSTSAEILSPGVGWGLLAGFSVLWVCLGVYWGRRAKGLEGYMLAGRNVGLALGAATCVATWVTSNTTLLAPQFALELGVWGMLAYSTAAIGLIMFAPMAQRIRKVMPRGYTSAEFIRLRYGRAAFCVFLAISIFYALTWMISMGMAGGLLLQALAGIPYTYGMSVVLLVCTLYTVFGGLTAVIGTDFIQSFIILCGIVIVGVAVLLHIDIGSIHTHLAAERPALLDALMPAAMMAVFNNLLFGIGEIFHSNVWWSRAFALREGVGKKAYLLAGALWLPIPIAAGFIALAAPALGVNVPQVNMVGPLVAAELLGSVGAVLVFIVVFSSIASSIDSLLAATSDLVTKDIVGRLWKSAEDDALRKTTLWVTAGLGVFTWLVCLTERQDLATVLFRAGPLVGSTIWPILLGLYWKRASALGATVAMVSGTATGLWAFYAVGWYVAALVGTAVSMVLTLGFTIARPDSFDWDRLKGEAV